MGDEQESQAKTATTDYVCAGERHYEDASYLHGIGRLLNADHLFGLAVECLIKAWLKRFAGPAYGVSMKGNGGSESDRLWWDNPQAPNPNKKRQPLGHIDEMLDALPILVEGRSGPALTEAIERVSADFEKWRVSDRYSDGSHLDQALLSRRQEAAALAHDLHLHVQFTGKLS